MSEQGEAMPNSNGKAIAGGKVKRLFESPYRIGSPEAPADFSHIGNGRGHLIDESIEDLIKRTPKKAVLVEEVFEVED